jgi:hypothetical protein
MKDAISALLKIWSEFENHHQLCSTFKVGTKTNYRMNFIFNNRFIYSIAVKPFFIRGPEDVTALSSEHVEFHCKVGGDPTPTITWKRQDGKMPIGRYQK